MRDLIVTDCNFYGEKQDSCWCIMKPLRMITNKDSLKRALGHGIGVYAEGVRRKILKVLSCNNISQEHPTAYMRGPLMATLSYLNFFSTTILRPTLSIAGKVSKKLLYLLLQSLQETSI